MHLYVQGYLVFLKYHCICYPGSHPLKKNLHYLDIKYFNQSYKKLVFNNIPKLLWKDFPHNVGRFFLVTWSSIFSSQIWGEWWVTTDAASCRWKIHKGCSYFLQIKQIFFMQQTFQDQLATQEVKWIKCLAVKEMRVIYVCSPTTSQSTGGSALNNN